VNVLATVANNKLYWFVARSSGMVAWSVCTASILWGLALSTRLIRRRGAPAWLLDLHRFLGLLSVVFTGVHMLALYLHSKIEFKEYPFGPGELFILWRSVYRPGPVAWGIVAFYLLVAVQITSWLMKRIRRKIWHTIHLSSFLIFGTATVHAFTAGTDKANRLVQWGALTGGAMVFFLLVFRLLAPKKAQLAEERAAREAAKGGTPAPVR
jgi:DMSO/TMAO reductase YedYZ heme-binding membrane subunit